MTPIRNCERCGAELRSGDGVRGMCPRCLMELAAGASAPRPAGGPPPSVDELAPLFPQLALEELVGRGGMGAVYRARQRELDRVVALKILPPEVQHDPSFAERFEREARALALLDHPGIVRVHDAGRAGGHYYVLMEYVDGVDLRRMIRNARVAPREALAIVGQVCDALQYAHDRGVVHRDVKPENILVDRRGSVKIADFGLAKMLRRAPIEPTLTRSDQAMGTLHYMAPEQMERPLSVDHRADIYSLGVVFYELLTGELPLGRFQPPSAKVAVDLRLDEVVLRALEKEPERRYQHASDVKIAADEASRPSVALAAAGGGAPAEPERIHARERAHPPHRRGPWPWILGCGCLFLLLPALGIAFLLPASMVRSSAARAEADRAGAEALREQARAVASERAARDVPSESRALRFDAEGPRLTHPVRRLLDASEARVAAAEAVLRDVQADYLAAESVHAEHELQPGGVLRLLLYTFPDERAELEARLWTDLEPIFSETQLSTLREWHLVAELMPFGEEALQIRITRAEGGSFRIEEHRPAADTTSITTATSLPERYARFWDAD